MNSETVSRYGKFVMYVLWLLGCLCAMAVVLLVEPQRVNIVIPIVVYMFVGLFLMSRFSGETAYTFDAFCYTFFGLASLLAVFVCVITQSSCVVCFLFRMADCLFFTAEKGCKPSFTDAGGFLSGASCLECIWNKRRL